VACASCTADGHVLRWHPASPRPWRRCGPTRAKSGTALTAGRRCAGGAETAARPTRRRRRRQSPPRRGVSGEDVGEQGGDGGGHVGTVAVVVTLPAHLDANSALERVDPADDADGAASDEPGTAGARRSGRSAAAGIGGNGLRGHTDARWAVWKLPRTHCGPTPDPYCSATAADVVGYGGAVTEEPMGKKNPHSSRIRWRGGCCNICDLDTRHHH
jgi:hypothetical protein